MGHLQGGVTDFSGLLAKDGPQQPLLCSQVGLALRGDLTDQNITGMDLGAHADDAALVQVLQGVVAHVGDVAGDLFRAQLGVAGLGLVFFNMDGGKDVVLDHSLVEQDGVLIVVTFPGHKAHQDVLAQGDLALVGGGAVGNDVALLHPVPQGDDGSLVDAGAVVGPQELDEGILHHIAPVIAHGDAGGGDAGDLAVVLGQHGDLGVDAVLVLHTGGHDGGLGGQQRHGLPLHVCTHQGTVGVVVFQEGDHGRCDGDHHPGRHVDVVHLLPVHFHDLVAVAAGDTLVGQAAVFVHRLRGLTDHVLVLDVGGHILHFVGEEAGGLIHLAVGGLDEAIPVDAGIGGQIGDQADVRTFGRLDGAHTAVVAVVDVSHVEGSAVTGQTTGAQSGHTALVGQLGQGVGLVHELRQGRRAKELFDGRRDRADVDEGLGGNDVQVLDGHALPDDTLHPAKADAELVLQQLAHAAQAAVAQVVDVVGGAHAVGQGAQIVDGGHDVIHDDVLGDEVILPLHDGVLQALFVPGVLVQQLAQDLKADLLADAALLGVKGDEVAHLHHLVGEDLDDGALHVHEGFAHAAVFQFLCLGAVQQLPGLGDDLAGAGVRHGGSQLLAGQTGPEGQLLVEFIAAHGRQVIPAGIEKQAVDEGLSRIQRGRLTRTQLPVDLQHGLLAGLAGVLLQGSHQQGLLAEHLQDLCLGLRADGADQARDGQLAVFINADVEDVRQVGLILQPSAAVRDDRDGVGDVLCLVGVAGVVDAGGTHDLGDDDALCAVDDEGAALGHQGEVAHEDLLLLDLLGLLVAQAHPDLQGGGIRGVAGLALLHVVLGLFVHGEVDEGQLQVAVIVPDGGYIPEDLPEAGVQEPLVRLLLDLQKVRHLQHFFVAGKALAQRFSVVYILYHCS